jgi:TldD protein
MASSHVLATKSVLASLIPLLERRGCIGDALYLRDATLMVNKDSTSLDVMRSEDEGVKLRVFDGVRYHERGLSGFDATALRQAARELGEVRKKKDEVVLDLPPAPLDADYSALGKKDPASISVKEKLAMTEDIHRRLASSSKKFINARVYYDEMRETKVFVSRTRKLSQEIGGCNIILIPFVKSKQGDIRYHYTSFFGHGYERTAISDAEIAKVARFAELVATAGRITPGKHLSLLSPHVTGLLAHESFGHGMEADTLYKGRAKALEFLGKRIASPQVSIADGPLEPGTHGFFFFDDEGWLATKTLMIDKGIVKRPLTDAYNAARLGVPRSSNARLESFDHKSYARMTNTYFEPGKDSKDELLSRIKDGLYLHNAAGGMEDPKGWGIQIQGVIAERVKDGKLTGELYYETGMTGYLPDVLGNILGVSKEFEIPGSGRCGKGHKDWVRVAEGGPYLLIKDVVLS